MDDIIITALKLVCLCCRTMDQAGESWHEK
jgi:hypothetical protein